MNKNVFIFGILTILLVFSVSAVPIINPAVLNQVKAEDSGVWTLDLSANEQGIAPGETGTVLDWSVSNVDNTLVNVVVFNIDEDTLRFTPVLNAHGSDTITLTLTSELGGTDTQDITVTLTPVNDAPVFTSVPDQEWKEGETKTLDLSGFVTDVDDDTLTFSVKEQPVDINVAISGSVATLKSQKSNFKGENEVVFSVTDGVEIVDSNVVNLLIVNEDILCEKGVRGDAVVDSIDNPDSGDEFKPGEIIKVDVAVSNNDDNEMDIIVEAFLYDKEKGKIIERAEADDRIEGDNDKDFNLEIVVPFDVDASSSKYLVFVKAYEDGDEDINCGSESVDVEIVKDTHDITIESVALNPSTAKCGDTVSATVKLFNTGEKDEDDVVVSLKESDLGVDVATEEFVLDKEDDYVARLSFNVAEDAKAGSYIAVVNTNFNNGKDSSEQKSATLVIEACKEEPKIEPKVYTLNFAGTSQLSLSMSVNDKANYLGSVFEVKDVSNLVKLDVDGSESSLSIGGNEVFDLDGNGSNDLKITLNSVNDGVASLTFNKLVTGPTGFVPVETEKTVLGYDLTTTLLVVGDALLVIVLIVILIVVFSRKRKK